MGIFVCFFCFLLSHAHTHTPLSHIGLDSYSLFHSYLSFFILFPPRRIFHPLKFFLIFFIAKGHAIRPYFHYFHFSFPLLWSPATMYNALSAAIRTYFVRIVLRPCSIIRLFLYFAVFGHPILTRNLIMYKRMMKKKITISYGETRMRGSREIFSLSRADE